MTLSDRVKAALQHAGKSQAQVAAELGMSTAAVSQWVKGRIKTLKFETASKLGEATGVRVEWLLSGVGQMVSMDSNVAPASIGIHRIPLISYVQAGVWTGIVDPYAVGDAEEWLLTDLDLSDHAFALQIKGESMLPDFRPGDRVIIDPLIAPQPGDFVVAKNGDQEATFKKYRPRGVNEQGQEVFELIPLNPDYPSMRSDLQPIHIVGTMVEHRKYRKRT